MNFSLGKKQIISPTTLPKTEARTLLNWFPGSREEKRWLLKLRLDVLSEAEREEVKRYEEKKAPQKRTAYIIWLLTGLVGGHRYYLHSFFWGLVLLFLLLFLPPGALAWWLVEGIRMSTLLEDRKRQIADKALEPVEARHRELVRSLKNNPEAVKGKLPLPIENWFMDLEDGFTLQVSEMAFMRTLYIAMQQEKLRVNDIAIVRAADGALVFSYRDKEIGRLNLQQKKHTMAVLLEGQFSVITGELDKFLSYQSVWLKTMETGEQND